MKKLDLDVKAVRKVDWFEENGLVKLKIVKFKSKLGKKLCKILKRPDYFIVNLDEIGSFIWKNCDGNNSIEEIMKKFEEKYGNEKLEELFIFMKILEKSGYIELK